MLGRTALLRGGGKAFKSQAKMFRKGFRESHIDKHINMDRVYRNLAMETRDFRRPWTFEKDMRGAIIHVTSHSPTEPMQIVGTILDVSHNETNLDAWVYLFFRKGRAIQTMTFPLMNPKYEYKIVRDRDEVKIWENFVKEMGHVRTFYNFGAARTTRKGDNSLFW